MGRPCGPVCHSTKFVILTFNPPSHSGKIGEMLISQLKIPTWSWGKPHLCQKEHRRSYWVAQGSFQQRRVLWRDVSGDHRQRFASTLGLGGIVRAGARARFAFQAVFKTVWHSCDDSLRARDDRGSRGFWCRTRICSGWVVTPSSDAFKRHLLCERTPEPCQAVGSDPASFGVETYCKFTSRPRTFQSDSL